MEAIVEQLLMSNSLTATECRLLLILICRGILESPLPLNLNDLSSETGIQRSHFYRHIRRLEERQFIIRRRGRRKSVYEAGPRLIGEKE